MRWFLLSVLFLLGLGGRMACAQVSPGAFRFEHLTVNDGLLHSGVETVAQDQSGFLGIGTTRGLNRHDSHDLKNYTLSVNPVNGIAGNRIHALHVGRDGRLWVGAEAAGLSLYDADHDRFHRLGEAEVPPAYRALLRQLVRADVMMIVSDPLGRLRVGNECQGVFVVDFDKQAHIRSLHQVALAENGATGFPVLSLVAAPDGQVWLGTLEAGLRGLRPGPVLRAPLPAATVPRLHLDRRGDLWIGTNQQVFWVAAANRRALRHLSAHPLPQPCRDLHALHFDTFGRLWVGTDYGLYMWSAGSVTGQQPPLRTARLSRPAIALQGEGIIRLGLYSRCW